MYPTLTNAPTRILITGPESTGKSTLAAALGHHFQQPWIPEYARWYLNALQRPYVARDLSIILRGQLALEAAGCIPGSDCLFCDTGPEVISIWSQVRFGWVSTAIKRVLLTHDYDYSLLCYPDLPWEFDPLREAPDPEVRLALFEQYVDLLERLGRPYAIIRGATNQRLLNALDALANVPDLQ